MKHDHHHHGVAPAGSDLWTIEQVLALPQNRGVNQDAKAPAKAKAFLYRVGYNLFLDAMKHRKVVLN